MCPQWGATDNASNSVLWSPTEFGLAPTRANANTLFGNSTADAYVTGETVGLYAVDATEIAVQGLKLGSVAINGPGTGGSYVPGDVLTVENTGATYSVGATANVTATEVRTAAVAAGGTGYANGDTVRLATGSGSNNGIFTVTTGAADTIVASVALTNRGTFTTNPTLSGGATANVTGTGSGCTLTVTTRVKSVAVINQGAYSVAPTEVAANIPTGGSGTGATLALTYANAGSKGVAHTGWVVRQEGTGGRAGRVLTEVLVAGGITSDTDDLIYPDA